MSRTWAASWNLSSGSLSSLENQHRKPNNCSWRVVEGTIGDSETLFEADDNLSAESWYWQRNCQGWHLKYLSVEVWRNCHLWTPAFQWDRQTLSLLLFHSATLGIFNTEIVIFTMGWLLLLLDCILCTYNYPSTFWMPLFIQTDIHMRGQDSEELLLLRQTTYIVASIGVRPRCIGRIDPNRNVSEPI